jgi:DNA polymerase-3 subunit alpha
MSDGASVTEHYCRRKNGLEEAVAPHPALEDALKSTYYLMLYQEQMMRISAEIAGFTKAQQGALRKAGAKKNQTLMSQLGTVFIEQAVALGKVTRAEAEQMFDDIRQSARYSFNRSHSTSYGLTGIETAWFKAHLPVSFFAGWLSEAKGDSDPRQEMMELVGDARFFGVTVAPPDARDLSAGVSVVGQTVRFGLADARGAGPGQVETLARLASEAEANGSRPRGDWSWAEWLGYTLSPVKGGVKKNVAEAWVGCGAFDFGGVSRTRMQKEYSAIAESTERELPALRAALAETRDVAAALTKFADISRKEGGPHDKRRRTAVLDAAKLLTDAASSDVDHPTAIAGLEEHLLGVALTCARVDGCDRSAANWTCKQFNSGQTNARMVIAVEVKDVRPKRTKKGDAMAYLTVDDGTDAVEATAFPDAFAAAKTLLYPGNCVVLEGRKDKKFGSFVVDKAFQLVDRG